MTESQNDHFPFFKEYSGFEPYKIYYEYHQGVTKSDEKSKFLHVIIKIN